jgi:hypothetical protein
MVTIVNSTSDTFGTLRDGRVKQESAGEQRIQRLDKHAETDEPTIKRHTPLTEEALRNQVGRLDQASIVSIGLSSASAGVQLGGALPLRRDRLTYPHPFESEERALAQRAC